MLDNQIVYIVIQCCVVVSIFSVLLIGDYLSQHAEIPLHAAFFDNLTHCTVGCLSWLIVCLNSKNSTEKLYFEVALCGIIASLIDLDHFYAARSFYLDDVRCLQTRPPLHSSTLPLVTSLILLYVAYVEKIQWMCKLSLILFTAFASHHVRDANRRGLWFYPFGSTKPLPHSFYVALTIMLPYYVALTMNLLNNFEGDPVLGPADVLIKVSVQ